MSVGTVIVAHQISRRRRPGKRLGDLPGQPLGGRMPRHLKPQQLSPAMAEDQKRKQEIKGQRRNDAQIDCGDRLSVISKKCLPALRRRLRRSHQVFRDSRLGNFEPEHQKLAMDPGCAPQRVFPAHPPDQIAQLTIDLRPPCPISGFPAPEGFEAGAMPPQDRLRLHHLGQIKQIRPNPRDPYQQRPVTTVQPQTRRRPPQGDVELMTKKQILGFEPSSRLEHVGDEHSEPLQDRKHRSE